MPDARFCLALAALSLGVACRTSSDGADASASGKPGRPVATRLYATVTSTFAPWDGSAESVAIFTGTGGGCGPAAAGVERVVIELWRGAVPLRAGTSFALGSTKQDGQLRVCGKDEHCTAVDATITIDAVSPQQITGSVSYAMPAGGNTTLPFLAARCPGHPGRGG